MQKSCFFVPMIVDCFIFVSDEAIKGMHFNAKFNCLGRDKLCFVCFT